MYDDCVLMQAYVRANVGRPNLYHWIEMVVNPTEWMYNKSSGHLEKKGLP